MNDEHLKLDNQICFPIYASSRLITKLYQPLLNQLGVTYPQYLVLLVLWEQDNVPVKTISEKLILESNTLTPLLKRMEKNEILKRERSKTDERIVMIKLTEKGLTLKESAQCVPTELLGQIQKENIDFDSLLELKKSLNSILEVLKKLDSCEEGHHCNINAKK